MLTSVYGNYLLYFVIMGRVCITINLLIDQNNILYLSAISRMNYLSGKVTKFLPGNENFSSTNTGNFLKEIQLHKITLNYLSTKSCQMHRTHFYQTRRHLAPILIHKFL